MKKKSPQSRFSQHLRQTRYRLRKNPLTEENIFWANDHLKKAFGFAKYIENKDPALGAWALYEVAKLEKKLAQVTAMA